MGPVALPTVVPYSVVKVKLTDSPIPTVPSNISTVTLASESLSLYVYDVGENPTTNPGMWERKERERCWEGGKKECREEWRVK